MKRLMNASKPWQPKIVTINETCPGDHPAAGASSLRLPRKTIIFGKQDVAAAEGNGSAVGTLTNNDRTTAMLMAPN